MYTRKTVAFSRQKTIKIQRIFYDAVIKKISIGFVNESKADVFLSLTVVEVYDIITS